MRRILFVSVLILFYFNAVSYSEDRHLKKGFSRKKAELSLIKKEIQKKKQNVKTIGKRKLSVISELNKKKKELSKGRSEISLLDSEVEELNKKIEGISDQVSSLGEAVGILRSRLDTRMAAMYKIGEVGYMKAVFSSRSYIDMLRCFRYMNIVLNYDLELIGKYKHNLLALKEKKKELEEGEKRLAILKLSKRKRESDIQAMIYRNTRTLNYIKSKKKSYTAKIKELEMDSNKLQSMINKLNRNRRKDLREGRIGHITHGFATLRGKLDIPVSGKILPLFGRQEDPTLNTFSFYKGIDIIAPKGSKIKAVYDGKVLFSNWFKGYGNIIIIDHGSSYYTLFAHASKLLKEVGEKVKRGEVIALVGDTDSINGPRLHFEIRYQGKPQNPMDWFVSASR